MTDSTSSARIETLRVKNFRVLQNVELKKITPLTVLVGPNGSGKSTLFDVFAFLSECFQRGLRSAWDKRGRSRELKTRDRKDPVRIEIQYREPDQLVGRKHQQQPLITYHLEIDEEKNGRPVVLQEWLQWRRSSHGRPFRFMEYKKGKGSVVSGEFPDMEDRRIDSPLREPDILAVNAFGQLADNPRIAALREFITGWHVSYFSSDHARRQPEAGPEEHLSRTGDNLANVIQYLKEQHAGRLAEIFRALRQRIPHIKEVETPLMEDGRLLLQIKDALFKEPVRARFVSDGTLKMLAYLVLLKDLSPAPFTGIEEPENFLHPRLLTDLAEEFRLAAGTSQILVTTHSPFFLDALKPHEVRVLVRDRDGYAKITSLDKLEHVKVLFDAGGLLGNLWMENQFGIGDPLTESQQWQDELPAFR